MFVLAEQAEAEFVGDGPAQTGCSGLEEQVDDLGMFGGGGVGGRPGGISRTGDLALDGKQVLHRKGMAIQGSDPGRIDAVPFHECVFPARWVFHQLNEYINRVRNGGGDALIP